MRMHETRDRFLKYFMTELGDFFTQIGSLWRFFSFYPFPFSRRIFEHPMNEHEQ